MKMNVPDGFTVLEVPSRLRALIPAKYGVEYFIPTPDYGKGRMLIVTYGRTAEEFVHVDGMLNENALAASDSAIKRAIIKPMLESMQRHIRHRDRHRNSTGVADAVPSLR